MNSEVLLLGVIVGGVNYLFRYLPLRLRVGHARPARRGPVSVLLDTIGIASICAR
ncbi:L-valine transporter subunit YgaH, partial [Pseudomonas aeruginosa]|nr:L-valine transporter subunit YgaH [Pseudomonas aeruginosa]